MYTYIGLSIHKGNMFFFYCVEYIELIFAIFFYFGNVLVAFRIRKQLIHMYVRGAC
jgi:hypothetical protein